jgi:hypothetical protein
MIFIFKRTIKNDMKLFLEWFKNEIEMNAYFREIYSPLVRGNLLCHGQFLIKQWHLSVERREYLSLMVKEQK